MLSLILSGPFTVIDEHFNSILPNCYDAIGLMLMIRIIHQHQVMLLALVIAVFIWALTFLKNLFQSEIGFISSNIKILQEKSMDMGLKLKNRKIWFLLE
ncbi:hypothetical protein Patl1_14125 [Pistacia atlantica]|uniref:Uncharacterized protein n=1 Tax=Pistacia atlantica TaxID=434234 RepID=A0ACC1AT58_9ROSI|nr:hypothetical protein Patl1_14125 [Pistacia atlantica]